MARTHLSASSRQPGTWRNSGQDVENPKLLQEASTRGRFMLGMATGDTFVGLVKSKTRDSDRSADVHQPTLTIACESCQRRCRLRIDKEIESNGLSMEGREYSERVAS